MSAAVSARRLFRSTGKTAREDLTRESDDFYPTPVEPIRSFLSAEGARLKQFGKVWECAAGDNAMMRELERYGLDVVASDLIDRGCSAEIKSFYNYSDPPSPCIVTNPPFKETNWRDGKGRWLYHALETLGVDYMALLLPWGAFGAGGFARFWNDYAPARVYLMRWKIDFTGQGSPPMLNAWYVWDGQTDPSDTRLLMLDRVDCCQGDFFEVAS